MSENPHVSVIILNWNGWRDTIECLESVLNSDYDNFHILLIDNGSSDDSVNIIKNWAFTNQLSEIKTDFPEYVYPLVEKPIDLIEVLQNVQESNIEIPKSLNRNKLREKSIIFIRNSENVGFAIGNNLGIEFGLALFKSKYFYLLNNDTVIQKSTIYSLICKLEENSKIGAATSAIRYYSKPDLIHNLGGRLTRWGAVRYYTSDFQLKNKKVSFLTGCSLIIKGYVIEKYGLLSENFFHGEEDFEYSLRLKKKGVEVACVQESIVYHKISIASDNLYKKGSLKRKFLHIFYRMIDMKIILKKPVWYVWRLLIYFYVFFWLMLKYQIRVFTTLKFLFYLNHYTNQFNNGKKHVVERIMQEVDL